MYQYHRLVCLVKHNVQLSGHLRYIHGKSSLEVVLLTSVWIFIEPNVSVVVVENGIASESCFIPIQNAIQKVRAFTTLLQQPFIVNYTTWKISGLQKRHFLNVVWM